MKEEIYKMTYICVENNEEEKKKENILSKLNKEIKANKEYSQILSQYFIQNNANKGKLIINNKKYSMNGINELIRIERQ